MGNILNQGQRSDTGIIHFLLLAYIKKNWFPWRERMELYHIASLRISSYSELRRIESFQVPKKSNKREGTINYQKGNSYIQKDLWYLIIKEACLCIYLSGSTYIWVMAWSIKYVVKVQNISLWVCMCIRGYNWKYNDFKINRSETKIKQYHDKTRQYFLINSIRNKEKEKKKKGLKWLVIFQKSSWTSTSYISNSTVSCAINRRFSPSSGTNHASTCHARRPVPPKQCSSWAVHIHFNVKGFKIITLYLNFQAFLQHLTKKRTSYWPFCIDYENNIIYVLIKYMQYNDVLNLFGFPT